MAFWYSRNVRFVTRMDFLFEETLSMVDALTTGYFTMSYASGFTSYGQGAVGGTVEASQGQGGERRLLSWWFNYLRRDAPHSIGAASTTGLQGGVSMVLFRREGPNVFEVGTGRLAAGAGNGSFQVE